MQQELGIVGARYPTSTIHGLSSQFQFYTGKSVLHSKPLPENIFVNYKGKFVFPSFYESNFADPGFILCVDRIHVDQLWRKETLARIYSNNLRDLETKHQQHNAPSNIPKSRRQRQARAQRKRDAAAP